MSNSKDGGTINLKGFIGLSSTLLQGFLDTPWKKGYFVEGVSKGSRRNNEETRSKRRRDEGKISRELCSAVFEIEKTV